MLTRTILFLLLTKNLYATPGVSDSLLWHTAMNTYNSTVELANILEQQQMINEKFDKMVQEVDNRMYKIDRFIMWADDLKEIPEMSVEQFNDFNDLLRRIKTSKINLINQINDFKFKQAQIDKSEHENNKAKKSVNKRRNQYKRDIRSNITSASAPIETAQNTKDISIELTEVNRNLTNAVANLNQITRYLKDQNEKNVEKEIVSKNRMGNIETKKGPFKKNTVIKGSKK